MGMSYDMNRIRASETSEKGYSCLNNSGMQTMRRHIQGVLCNTRSPSFEDLPEEWPGETRDEFYDWYHERLPDPPAGQREFQTARVRIDAQRGFRSSEPGKVPSRKLGSNDGWIVVPEECLIIADELARVLPDIPPDYWRDIVVRWEAFNRMCATHGGYAVTESAPILR